MKSKLLVLCFAPAMLIAVSSVRAADVADDSSQKPPHDRQKEMIARFDKDGDGKLNDEEKAAAKAAMQEHRDAMEKRRGGHGAGMHEAFMRRYDADGDGRLSEQEREKGKADWKAFVAKYDKDGDGKLSPEEHKVAAEAFAGEHPEAAARMRAAVDKDGDGTISPQERREAAREMRKKHRPQPGAEPADAAPGAKE